MAETNDQLERRIHERAFQLWQEAGCPEGRAEEFWHRAHQVETSVDTAEDIVDDPPTGDHGNFA